MEIYKNLNNTDEDPPGERERERGRHFDRDFDHASFWYGVGGGYG